MTETLFPANAPQPDPGDSPAAAAPADSPFRIGEVCRLTGTKAFVLRYWETEFPMLAPDKNPRGHRLYRRQDVDLVFEIKRLLYEQGFTIAGARRFLEARAAGQSDAPSAEPPAAEPAAPPAAPVGSAAARKVLVDLDQELRAILTLLESG
jgi:DNA-binding transcriptional MerR regulator